MCRTAYQSVEVTAPVGVQCPVSLLLDESRHATWAGGHHRIYVEISYYGRQCDPWCEWHNVIYLPLMQPPALVPPILLLLRFRCFVQPTTRKSERFINTEVISPTPSDPCRINTHHATHSERIDQKKTKWSWLRWSI